MKKSLLGLVCIMIMGIGCFFVGCGTDYKKAKFLTSQEQYTINLGANGQAVDLEFDVEIDDVGDVTLFHSLKNEGVISVNLTKIRSNAYRVNVHAIRQGQCVIKLFLAEDHNVSKEIKITVVQSIQEVSIKSGYQYFFAIGERGVLDLGDDLIVNPSNSNRKDLRYEISENISNLPVSITPEGFFDASSCSNIGMVKIKVYASETIYDEFVLNLIQAVQASDFSLNLNYANQMRYTDLWKNGRQSEDIIELIKTGGVGDLQYLSNYNKAFVNIRYQGGKNLAISYRLNGDSVSSVFLDDDWHDVQDEMIALQGNKLGTSTLTLRINVRGAEEFLRPIYVSFEVVVIDMPTSIAIEDPTKNNLNVYENLDGTIQCNIYNNYAEGILGQAIRISSKPNSVADANSTLVIDFSDSANLSTDLIFFDENSNRINPRNNKIYIKSGDLIYVRSLISNVFVATYDVLIYSEFSKKFENEGALVSKTMRLSLYEGISSLRIEDTVNYYLNLMDENEKSVDISLNIGTANANTNSIYFKVNDSNLVEVEKQSDLLYRVTAKSQGVADVTFYTGNGYETTVQFTCFNPVTNVKLSTQSEFQNPNIGKIEYIDTGLDGLRIKTINVKVGGRFTYDIITNPNATIYEIRTVIPTASQALIEVQEKTGTIFVKGVVNTKITFRIFGYNKHGVQTAQEVKSIDVEINGYIAVDRIELSSQKIKLKDPNSISYTKRENLTKSTLMVSVYPANAQYNVQDIKWNISNDACSLENASLGEITGVYAKVRANTIYGDGEMVSCNVTVSLTIFGREYTDTCEIQVEKAQKVEKVYIDNAPDRIISFDSRKGLGSSSTNKFKLQTRIFPNDAYDTILRYDKEDQNPTDGSGEVFDVDHNGVITPLKGGTGVLRIVPQDAFSDRDVFDTSMAYRIRIVVEDGLRKSTAYSVYTVSDLQNIGRDQTTLSRYYKLANDISLQSTPITPIGSPDLPFTGWFSGANIVYEDVDESVIAKFEQHTIKDFTLSYDHALKEDNDTYYGLFGCVECAEIVNVDLQLSISDISVQDNTSGSVYFGALVGFVYGYVAISVDESKDDLMLLASSISNCSVRVSPNAIDHKLSLTTSAQNVYAGALIGFAMDTRYSNKSSEQLNQSDKVAVNLQNFVINSSSSSKLNVGGIAGYMAMTGKYVKQNDPSKFMYNIYQCGFKGADYVKAVSSQEAISVSYYSDDVVNGYDVYVKNFRVNQNATVSESAIGGVIGKTEIVVLEIIVDELPNFGGFGEGGEESNVTSERFFVADFSFGGNIYAKADNVGGIVGLNGVHIKNCYFDGRIDAEADNVGGIAGQSIAEISESKVYTYGEDEVIKGEDNVGGILGLYSACGDLNEAMLTYCYVSGVINTQTLLSNRAICGTSNVGALIGFVGANLAIFGCYSDVMTNNSDSASLNVSSSVSVNVRCSYFINTVLPTSNCELSYNYELSVSSSGGNPAFEAIYYDQNGGSIDQSDFLTSTSDYFVSPSALGVGYENINFGFPIIKYNETYLYNVVYSTMKIKLETNDRVGVISSEEGKENILVFYYQVDSQILQSLDSSQKEKVSNAIKERNTFNINDILTLFVSPKPFSNIYVNVKCLQLNGTSSSDIAYIDAKGLLIIMGEGVFILKFTSKLNPALSREITINVVNYVSSFGLYHSNHTSSTRYSTYLNNDFEVRVGEESKQLFAIVQNLYEIADKSYALIKNTQIGVRFDMAFDAEHTTKLLEVEDSSNDDSSSSYGALYVGGEAVWEFGKLETKKVKTTDGETGTEKIEYEYKWKGEDVVEEYTSRFVPIASIEYILPIEVLGVNIENQILTFQMSIEGVIFEASSNSFSGSLEWGVKGQTANSEGKYVITAEGDKKYTITINDKGIQIKIEKDLVALSDNMYYFANFGDDTSLKNSLLVAFEIEVAEQDVTDENGETVTDENGEIVTVEVTKYGVKNDEYYYGKLVNYSCFVKNTNGISFSAWDTIVTEIEAYPYFEIINKDQTREIYTLNLQNVHKEVFVFRGFEGAKEISSELGSAEYSPTDAINTRLYMISDSSIENLKYEISQDDKKLKVDISSVETQIYGNDFIHVYDVTITLDNTYSARYFAENKTYKIRFYSEFRPEVSLEMPITYIPQALQRLDLANYKVIDSVIQDNAVQITTSKEMYGYISAGLNGVMSIDMYPAYAGVDELKISSDIVDGLYINFWQMNLKSTENSSVVYQELSTQSRYEDGGKTLVLQKILDSENSFNGKYYVRTFLGLNAEAGSVYTITVSGYKKDALGQSTLLLSNTIRLEVTAEPKVEIQSENYVIKGNILEYNVKITNADTSTTPKITISSSNENGSIVVADLNNDKPIQVINTGSYNLYKYRLVVNPLVQNGTILTITADVTYTFQGQSGLTKSAEKEVQVLDFKIKEVNLDSPFNQTNSYATMYMYEIAKIGVHSIDLFAMLDYNVLAEYFGEGYKDRFEMLQSYGGYVDNSNPMKVIPIQKSGDEYFIEYVIDNVAKKATLNFKDNKFEFSENAPSFIDNYTFEMGIKTKEMILRNALIKAMREQSNYFTIRVENGEIYVYETLQSFDSSSGAICRGAPDVDSNDVFELVGKKIGSDYVLRLAFNYTIELDGSVSFANAQPDNQVVYYYERLFNVSVYSKTSIDLPQEIYSQVDFEKMQIEGAGKDYILMNDLTLVDYAPIRLDVASFDGNSKVITLRNFSQEALSGTSVNLGLFSSITTNTYVKNLTLDVSRIKTIDVSQASSVNVGLFAVSNYGIITNCEVISSMENQVTESVTNISKNINGVSVYERDKTNTLELITPKNYSLVPQISLFVVNNYASITHSRVMDYKSNTTLKLIASGELAGFAVSNTGKISSSFVNAISIVNQSEVVKDSKTAGFVINNANTGSILQSFVEGSFVESDTTDNENYRSKVGYIHSGGVIAGFVYSSSGIVLNSYSNISLISNAGVAGFVYTNIANGTMENCYSACNITTNSAVHMPFVGSDALSNVLVADKNALRNCYFIGLPTSDNGSYVIDQEYYPAVDIASNKVSNESNFGGFNFGSRPPTTSDSSDSKEVSVWYMDSKGPRLSTAENIVKPSRYMSVIDGVKSFTFQGDNSELGERSNPYTIASAKEYNQLMARATTLVGNSYKIISDKYVRIVNDIDFNQVNKEVFTSECGLIGCEIEGNGFALKNVVLNSKSSQSSVENIDSLGLFAYIMDSNVRNLNLQIVQAECENVRVLGSLAGAVSNSNISNINATSTCIMSARFVAGGVIGIVLGDSKITGLTASVGLNINYKQSVKKYAPNSYTSGSISGDAKKLSDNSIVGIQDLDKIEKISYAGGAIGIIDAKLADSDTDIGSRLALGGENVNNIRVYGDVSLDAQFVGGAVGFVGSLSHVSNAFFELKYNDVRNAQYLRTEYCAGGLVAENHGAVSRSAVKYSTKDTQYVDSEILTYLNTGSDVRKGKKDLFRGDMWVVGGLVGINDLGYILHSYSRADIIDNQSSMEEVTEQYLGGIVGISYLGNIDTVYASGNVCTEKSSGYVGGILGRLNNIYYETNSTQVRDVEIKNVYAINLWDSTKVQSQFVGENAHAGIFVGYSEAIGGTGDMLSIKGYYTSNISIADNPNYLQGRLFEVSNNSEIITIVGASEKFVAKDNNQSTLCESTNIMTDLGLNYKNLFTEEQVANREVFLATFGSSSDKWILLKTGLPDVKQGAIAIEEEISNIFEFAYVVKNTPYKNLRITQDLDFDLSNYKIADNKVYQYRNNEYKEIENTTFVPENGRINIAGQKIFNLVDYGFGGTKSGEDKDGDSCTVFENNYLNFRSISNFIFTGKIIGQKIGSENPEDIKVKFDNINFSDTIQGGRRSFGIFADTKKTSVSHITFNVIAENYAEKSQNDKSEIFAVYSQRDISSVFIDCDINLIKKNSSTENSLTLSNHIIGGFVGVASGAVVYSACTISLYIKYTSSEDNTNISNYVGALAGNAKALIASNITAEISIEYIFAKSVKIGVANVGTLVGQAENVDIRYSVICPYDTGTDDAKDFIITAKKTEDEESYSGQYYSYPAYIGGMVGRVMNGANIDGAELSGKIDLADFVSLNCGGVIGYGVNTLLRNIKLGEKGNVFKIYAKNLNTTQVAQGSSEVPHSDMLYLGGLVGIAEIKQSSAKEQISNCTLYIDIDVEIAQNSAIQTENYSIGGAFGVFSAQTFSAFTNQYLYVHGTIDLTGFGEAHTVKVGGVIGENKMTKVNNSNTIPNAVKFAWIASFVDISLNQENSANNIKANAGGFLGSSTRDSDNGNYMGKLEVRDSVTAGSILCIIKNIKGYVGAFAGGFEGNVLGCTVATTLYLGSSYGASGNELKVSAWFGFANSSAVKELKRENETKDSRAICELIGFTQKNSQFTDNSVDIPYADWVKDFKGENNPDKAFNDKVIDLFDWGNAGAIMNPKTDGSGRYNSVTGIPSSYTDNEMKVISFGKNVVEISGVSLFSDIGGMTLVSNVVLNATNATVPLVAGINNGIVVGLYAYGTSTSSSLLFGTNSGVLIDAMLDVDVSVPSGTAFSMIEETSNGAYIFNAQFLGSVKYGDGQTNTGSETLHLTSKYGTTPSNYLRMMYATNIISKVNVNLKTIKQQANGSDTNTTIDYISQCIYDITSMNYTLEVKEGEEPQFVGYKGYTYYTDSPETKQKNGFPLLDVAYNDNYNYGYIYLERFEKEIKDKPTTISGGLVKANNFSRLYHILQNQVNIVEDGQNVSKSQNALLINDIKWTDHSLYISNVYNGKIQSTETNNFVISNLHVSHEDGENNVPQNAFFSVGMQGAEIKNVTFKFSRLNSLTDNLVNSGYQGILTNIAKDCTFTNLSINAEASASSDFDHILGYVVGGVIGKAEDCTLSSVSLSNAKIRALDLDENGAPLAGVAGGLVGYATGTNIANCSLSAVYVVSGNGKKAEDDGDNSTAERRNAGAVGGVVAVCNGGTISNVIFDTGTNTVKVISGDAGDGSTGDNGTFYTKREILYYKNSNQAGGGTKRTPVYGDVRYEIPGEVGGDGGEAFIGGIAGIIKAKLSIDSLDNKISISEYDSDTIFSRDTTNSSSVTFDTKGSPYTRLHDNDSEYLAGRGGQGGNGRGGTYGCQSRTPCNGGSWASGWHHCDHCEDAGDAGSGGKGGRTYIGEKYGKCMGVDYMANQGSTTSYFKSAPGGDGGHGGDGGTRHFEIKGWVFGVWVTLHKGDHYGYGGDGADSGPDGNYTYNGDGTLATCTIGECGSSSAQWGGKGGKGASQDFCYLQSKW